MSIVTDLQFQKKNKNRVNVFVDDEFFVGASLEATLKFGLKKGQEIDKTRLKEFVLADQKQKAITKATDLISKFVKTEKEIKTYLKEKGFADEVVFETCEKLKEYGLINDEQFAISYVNFKKNVSGKNKLKAELLKKGVSKGIIDKVLNDLDECGESEKSCLAVAKKYMKNKEKTNENKVKLNRFLVSRGFDFADIKQVINQIIEGDDDEMWD